MQKKEEYKYTMAIYIATMELPSDGLFNVDGHFSFEELSVPYKKAAGKYHLKTYEKDGYILPYGLDKIEPYQVDERQTWHLETSNGCLTPSRRLHWYMCFSEKSDVNEAIARKQIAGSIDRFIDFDSVLAVGTKIRKHRNDLRIATEAKRRILEGASDKWGVLPLHDKKAILYWLGERNGPVFEYCEVSYYVKKTGYIVSDNGFHGQLVRECDFGKAFRSEFGTSWALFKERDDVAALKALKEAHSSTLEWRRKEVRRYEEVLAAAESFTEAKLR